MSVMTKSAAAALAHQGQGSYSDVGNVMQHTLYDTRIFPTTTMPQQTQFFVVGIGGAHGAGIKTRQETNLQDSGKLPNGQTFLVKEMAVAMKNNFTNAELLVNQPAEDVMNAWWTMMENSYFNIKLAGREFDLEVNGSEFIPLNHMVGRGASTPWGPQRLQGDTIQSGWYRIKSTPIVLSNLVTFSVIHFASSVNLQARLNTACHTLFTQSAEYKVLLRGILTRNI